jgi:hypothetical protein
LEVKLLKTLQQILQAKEQFEALLSASESEIHGWYSLQDPGDALKTQCLQAIDRVRRDCITGLGHSFHAIAAFLLANKTLTTVDITAVLNGSEPSWYVPYLTGSVLQIKNKKFKAQIGVKYDVGTARRDYDVTLGQAWSIEEHASHATRLFCGQGYTTGKFVNPQFESKEAAMSRGRHVVMATKKEFGYNLFGYN